MVSTLTKMVLVIGCIIILLHAGGILPNTISDTFIQLFLHPENLSFNSFYNAIKDNGIKLVVTTIAVTIGTFSIGSSSLVIKSATSLFVINMVLELTGIFNLLKNDVGIIFSLIFVGLMMVITCMAALEWITQGT